MVRDVARSTQRTETLGVLRRRRGVVSVVIEEHPKTVRAPTVSDRVIDLLFHGVEAAAEFKTQPTARLRGAECALPGWVCVPCATQEPRLRPRSLRENAERRVRELPPILER